MSNFSDRTNTTRALGNGGGDAVREQLAETIAELRYENARLRGEIAYRDAAAYVAIRSLEQ